MNDEHFEIQKIIINFFSSQLIAHATYLLTTAAITVAILGIFLTYTGRIIIKLILIFLFSFSFSASIYALGRWKYFADLTSDSMTELLVRIIEEIPPFKPRERILEIVEKLKRKYESKKGVWMWFVKHCFNRFRWRNLLIYPFILGVILSVLYWMYLIHWIYLI